MSENKDEFVKQEFIQTDGSLRFHDGLVDAMDKEANAVKIVEDPTSSLPLVNSKPFDISTMTEDNDGRHFSPVYKYVADFYGGITLIHENGKETHITRQILLERLKAMLEGMKAEKGAKSADELKREVWLMEEGLNAWMTSARMCGIKFESKWIVKLRDSLKQASNKAKNSVLSQR